MTALEKQLLVNQYFLTSLAGEGGMGQVYKAWDRKRGAYMAVKTIRESRFVESFIREAQALIELSHPNIMRFYNVGIDQKVGVAFIVMDWVDGKDLQSLIKKRKSLGVGEVTHIFEGIQKALYYAHERKVCHCDLKPGNILIRDADNQVILSDFGLAHAAHDQGGGGTLPFMAPELFNPDATRRKYSVSSDIYALGVTLYQLLSGHLPFSGDTREQIIQAHRIKSPPPLRNFNPRIPDGIVLVIEKSLSKDPRYRQKSITEMYLEFLKYTSGEKDAPLARHAPTLIGIKGENVHKKIKILGQKTTIGRSKINEVHLRHLSVSRYHASIVWQQGSFFIRDNGSSVGTYLNSRRLESNTKEKLRNGDKIRIGVVDQFEYRDR